MNNENDNLSELNGKAVYFYKNKMQVHIILNNNRFYNGIILEIAENEFLILMDRFNGQTPIFFSEIKGIEKYQERIKDEQ